MSGTTTRGGTPLGLELQGLYDCARLARELGISRRAADRIMLRCDKQMIPGLRKVYVRGGDVQRLLDENVNDAKIEKPLGRVA